MLPAGFDRGLGLGLAETIFTPALLLLIPPNSEIIRALGERDDLQRQDDVGVCLTLMFQRLSVQVHDRRSEAARSRSRRHAAAASLLIRTRAPTLNVRGICLRFL